MVKRNDRWSALSMKERADLIKLYVSNGITSLENIKKDYNSFGDGGDTEPLYYDDTYIEPAVVKAFKSEEDYNRFLGEKGARIVREGTNRVAQNIFKGLQYTPVVGDAIDVADAAASIENGDVSKAAIIASLAVLPNAIEKPLKSAVKPLKRYLTHGIDSDLFKLSMRRWKGAPMPSMAVNDLDMPMFDYGNMTFLGSEDLLDNSLIFRGDGSTPTVSTVGGTEMMDPKEVVRRMRNQQMEDGYNIGQMISKSDASILPIRNGSEEYFEAKYQDFIPWAEFKHLITKGNIDSDLVNLIESLNIPHTNVSEEKYLETIKRLAIENGLTFANGGRLDILSTDESSKNNNVLYSPGLTEWFDTYVDSNTKFSVVPEAPIDENELVKRQAWAESAGNDKAGSHKGAKGRYQIMPNTLLEYQKATGDIGDIYDPVYNRRVRDWEFNRYKNSGQVNRGEPTDSVKMGRRLAIYNYGYGNTRKALNRADSLGIDTDSSFDWLQEFPKETQDYVNFILRGKNTGAHRTNSAYKNRKK